MGKILKTLFWIIALAAAALIGTEYYAVKNIEIEINDMDFESISLTKLKVNFNATAKNPTPFDAMVSKVYIEIYSNNERLGVVDRRISTIVEGKSSANIDFPCSISNWEALKLIMREGVSSSTKFIIQGNTTFKSKWFGFEINLPLEREEYDYQP